jgi:hypothetical protein
VSDDKICAECHSLPCVCVSDICERCGLFQCDCPLVDRARSLRASLDARDEQIARLSADLSAAKAESARLRDVLREARIAWIRWRVEWRIAWRCVGQLAFTRATRPERYREILEEAGR